MKRNTELLDRAELAARATIKDWIRRALRESFLQALRQALTIRHNHHHQASTRNDRDSSPPSHTTKEEDASVESEIQVELSSAGLKACFSFVERVSRAWQTKLNEEQHQRVAAWVAEVHRQGKLRLWLEPREESNDMGDNNPHLNRNLGIENLPHNQLPTKKSSSYQQDGTTTQESSKETAGIQINAADDSRKTESPSNSEKDSNHGHPNIYSRLRALGRRRNVDSPVMSIPDALQELKELTRNHPTYWPLNTDIIDQACLDMVHRTRASDKHGSGGTLQTAGGGKSFTKKAVRFKVLPKSVWETKQQQQQHQHQQERHENQEAESSEGLPEGDESTKSNNDQESNVETLLLASMKRKKSADRTHNSLHAPQKRVRISSRLPFDVPQSSDGTIQLDLSLQDKKVLDGLLLLDDEQQDAEGGSQPTAAAPPTPEEPLGLFGGLQLVGRTNYMVQNPDTGGEMIFMAKDHDKITRRKEKASIQERLDPNRIEIGRTGDPAKRKSKVLRTENWFDDQKNFFDFDLGWCLLEIMTEGNQKRLCAFSSLEISLEDFDS